MKRRRKRRRKGPTHLSSSTWSGLVSADVCPHPNKSPYSQSESESEMRLR